MKKIMPVNHIQTYTGWFLNDPIDKRKLIKKSIHPAIMGNDNTGGYSQYSLPEKMPAQYDMRISNTDKINSAN
jgi:hypothetical protein